MPVVRFRSRLVMAMVTTKNIRYRVIFSTTRGEFSHFGGSNDVKISIFGAKYLRDPPPLGVPASWPGLSQAPLVVGGIRHSS